MNDYKSGKRDNAMMKNDQPAQRRGYGKFGRLLCFVEIRAMLLAGSGKASSIKEHCRWNTLRRHFVGRNFHRCNLWLRPARIGERGRRRGLRQ